MDVLLPNGDMTEASRLYGKYKNITEKTVRLCDNVRLRYFLLKGKTRAQGDDVYSILCVKYERDEITDSEFVFDVTSKLSDATYIYNCLCRNTVTPECLYEALDNILFEVLSL